MTPITPAPTVLRKRQDFLRLKAAGKRLFKTAFVLQYQAVASHMGLGIGYTASTKGIGNAVQRNRARRRLKAAIAAALKTGSRPPHSQNHGHDLALIARSPVLTQAYALLLQDVTAALHEAGILA